MSFSIDTKEIRLLDKATIDKIAAGEVVERPASVAKELIENSIDSGARNITVEWKDGGIGYLRVTDDGDGIPADQLRNAFLRHSTSKLREAEELSSIATLGFRGEALSSIAAVSKVEVLTKTRDSLLGTHYAIEGSVETENMECAAPEGTTVYVRQLFYNTPARRKFLKSPLTEGNYINELVGRLALSHPDISFSLISQGRDRIFTSGNGKLFDCIFRIEGRETAENLIRIAYKDGNMKLDGYVGRQILERANRSRETFFVNGRYISSKILSKAVEDGCQGYLMLKKFPYCILFIELPEGMVDVNVHPRKAEVRFTDEKAVYDSVYAAVSNAFKSGPDIYNVVTDEKPAALIAAPSETSETAAQLSSAGAPAAPQENTFGSYEEKQPEAFETKRLQEYKERLEYESRELERSLPAKNEQITFLSPEAKNKHRIVGQIFDTYWIVEYEKSLYMIDQHAAHEKVLYERTMRLLSEKKMTSQVINPPIVIPLSPLESETLFEYGDSFREMGYEIENFGGSDYMLSAVPANMFSIDPRELFLSTLSDLAESGRNPVKVNDSVLIRVATLSCKAAVKGNERMSEREAHALIEELFTLENPYHCPHGRPTMIRIEKTEIEKRFNRIVTR